MTDTNTSTPIKTVKGFFTDHPASVDETYFQHMRFAFSFAGLLFMAGGAALIHAVFPAMCETTASRLIRKMYARIENRHAH